MKVKALLIVLLSVLSVFTIAVRAERHYSRIESSQKGTSSLPLLPRFVASSVVTLFAAQQEQTDLVLAGSVFLLFGFLSRKRARRRPSRLAVPIP
jgi:hypothetical protein